MVSVGQTITYTLTVSNVGDGASGPEVVTDMVPANSTYVAGSASCNGAAGCNASFLNNTVTFTLSLVAPHTSALPLTFKVTVNNNPTGTLINNVATFTGPGCTSGCQTNPTQHTVLNPPVLTVNKVGCATTAIPGEVFFYTISFANTGGGVSTNTVLTDILPPASQAIVNNPGGGTVTTVGGQPALVWNLGTVAPHTAGSETVKFIVTGTSGSIVNSATIASSNAAVTSSTTSTVTTPISSAGAITHGSTTAEVDLLGIPLIHQLGFTSSVAPGTPQSGSNQVIPTIGLGSLLSLGLIDQNSQSSVGLTATSTASSQIAGVSLLNGAITADVIRAQSNSTAEASGSNHGSGGSNYVNLKVNGVAQSTVAPNTALAITLGALTIAKVVLNEDTGSIVTSGGLTRVTDAVNMVDITLLAPLGTLPIGAHIIIGQTREPMPPSRLTNPACGTTPGSVRGYAFTAYAHATLLNSQLINTIVDNVSLPATGGGSTIAVNGTFITGLAASGTATDTTSGSLSPNPHSASDSRIQGLNLLNGSSPPTWWMPAVPARRSEPGAIPRRPSGPRSST